MHLTQVQNPTASVIHTYMILICDFYTFKPASKDYAVKHDINFT